MNRTSIALGSVLLLILLAFGGGWYIDRVNRHHPAAWPMIQGDAGNRFATRATFPQSPEVLFTLPLDEPPASPPVIGEDGTIYLLALDGLTAVDEQGRKRWTWRSKERLFTATLGRHGDIYVVEEGGVAAVDRDGRLTWRLPIEIQAIAGPLLVGQGGVIYLTTERALYAISPEGRVRWSYEAGPILTWPVEAPDGKLLLVTQRDELVAFAPNGEQAWTREVAPLVGRAMAVSADGRLYYRHERGLLILNSADGRSLQEVERPTARAFNLSIGKGFVQDGLNRFELDGRPLWSQDPAEETVAMVTYLDARGNLLLYRVGRAEGRSPYRLAMLDAGGEEAWVFEEVAPVTLPAIGRDGRICLVGRKDGEGYSLVCIGQK
ncbi:MAG: PQQ-binding-like beta-propeller repeat protein [Bacillota bacterium]